MSVAQATLHELKTALRLDNETITSWMESKKNPNGEKVTRTNVYQAIRHGTPKWLIDEIILEIRESHQKYPGYWKKHRKNT